MRFPLPLSAFNVVLLISTVSFASLTPITTRTKSDGNVDGMSLGDVDGDGQLETAVISRNGSFESGALPGVGSLALFDRDGEIAWERSPGGDLLGFPAFADLTGNGNHEVIVCEGGEGASCVAYDAQGDELWPERPGPFYYPAMVGTAPVTGDLNGDGADDVVISSWGGVVAAIDGTTGKELWRNEDYATTENFFGNSSLGDLNGDGHKDVIALGHTQGTVAVFDGTNGHELWAARHLRDSDGNYSHGNGVLVTDFDDSSPGMEVVVALRGTVESAVFAFASNGNLLWREPVNNSLRLMAPVAADVNGDLFREIFVQGVEGELYQFDKNGRTNQQNPIDLGAPCWGPPSFLDTNEDGIVEVIVSTVDSIFILDLDDNPAAPVVFHTESAGGLYPSPLVADINKNRQVDLITGSWNGQSLIRLELDTSSTFQWTTLGGDNQHSGEHQLGSIAGDYITQLTFIIDAVDDWRESVTKGGVRDKLWRTSRHLKEARSALQECSDNNIINGYDALVYLVDAETRLSQNPVDPIRSEVYRRSIAEVSLGIANDIWLRAHQQTADWQSEDYTPQGYALGAGWNGGWGAIWGDHDHIVAHHTTAFSDYEQGNYPSATEEAKRLIQHLSWLGEDAGHCGD